ncbi:Uncharacterised protein [Legionella beliardensis]|uniref:Secreted protein n=1 Tax=Legionella beliardensis TaxID=91822 RepID=A0A378I2U2_9GAMM|nr:hypothetical protein [Legionella beliardensis]STX28986.1 Uncharacterised protein [Legionella beliardensis]
MKKLLSLLFILSASITSNALSASCSTHIECPANTQCVCSTGASSAYSRYFYFDVKLQKGFHYECTLSTSIFNANVLDRISLPKGAEYQQPSSPRFPLKLNVDTTNMENQDEIISIRFLVPPSDMADDFQGICHIKEGVL